MARRFHITPTGVAVEMIIPINKSGRIRRSDVVLKAVNMTASTECAFASRMEGAYF